MQFPNAYTGVKRIRTSEILGLIAALCLLVTAIMTLAAAASAAAESMGGAVASLAGVAIFGIAASVLSIIALIICIVGLSTAGRDEPQFKYALYAVLAGLVASVIGTFISNESVKDIFTTLQSAANLVSTIFVISGIMSLAKKLNNDEVAARGNGILKLIICVNVLVLIANIITIFVPNAETAAAVIALIAAVLSIVQYIIYLGYLKKAVVMLGVANACDVAEAVENQVEKVAEAVAPAAEEATEAVEAAAEQATEAVEAAAEEKPE
ncbi:MAG: hypothetical protein IJT18_02000 [Oscillospiraceae bacterium]|nr:hypothetical protein [Oscillospiraceae bacterium]